MYIFFRKKKEVSFGGREKDFFWGGVGVGGSFFTSCEREAIHLIRRLCHSKFLRAIHAKVRLSTTEKVWFENKKKKKDGFWGCETIIRSI